MKFKIIHTLSEDSVIIEAETIEEIREKAAEESRRRNWRQADCYSIELKH